MCKLNKKNDSRFRDPCITKFMINLNYALKHRIKLLASCCGHGKYPMTIIVSYGENIFDLVSGTHIKRKTKFYKKDKQGYYYIPELKK